MVTCGFQDPESEEPKLELQSKTIFTSHGQVPGFLYLLKVGLDIAPSKLMAYCLYDLPSWTVSSVMEVTESHVSSLYAPQNPAWLFVNLAFKNGVLL